MKLQFIYSPIYDNLLTDMSRKEFSTEQMKEMEFYKEELEATWKRKEKKIINVIEKTAKLKFKGNKTCFLVNNMKYKAISNPLTLKKEPHLERAKTIIIHELVHILLEDNKEKIKQLIEKIYPEESMEFKIHIPVLLITRKVVETIFGKELYEEIIKDEMKRDVLNSAWPEVNSIYDRFKKDIIKFLKNEKLS
ncbi:hypothetical protein J4230_03195 [Candidatus Woesearchaeota archaeon]|nr:hypothetical protein [Candidatus Woesearchaeota archaeon]